METTQLNLAVTTPLDNLRNRTIESNVKDLLPIVQAKAREYRDTQYGITQEKICKEDRARLNKFQIAINDELKEIQKANNEPYKKFECEVQPVIDAVAEAIRSLDKQLEEMENLWRTNNLENAKLIFNKMIAESKFGSWIPWEKVLITKKTARVSYEDFFGNKTTWTYAEGHEDTKDIDILMKAGKKVSEVFENLMRSAQDKLDAVNATDYPEEIKMHGIGYLSTSYDPIKRGFDMEGTFKIMSDLARREREKAEAVEKAKREAEAEKQRALEEQKRQAEIEKQKAIEEAERKARAEAEKQKPEPVQMNVTDYIPNVEEKKYSLRFAVELTATQAKQLRAFCDSYGIKLTQIK